jgi:hypothetical protein
MKQEYSKNYKHLETKLMTIATRSAPHDLELGHYLSAETSLFGELSTEELERLNHLYRNIREIIRLGESIEWKDLRKKIEASYSTPRKCRGKKQES